MKILLSPDFVRREVHAERGAELERYGNALRGRLLRLERISLDNIRPVNPAHVRVDTACFREADVSGGRVGLGIDYLGGILSRDGVLADSKHAGAEGREHGVVGRRENASATLGIRVGDSRKVQDDAFAFHGTESRGVIEAVGSLLHGFGVEVLRDGAPRDTLVGLVGASDNILYEPSLLHQ